MAEASSFQKLTKSRSRMTYLSLSSPVACEWVFPDSNLLCGLTFTSMEQFTHHVRDQHLQNPNTPGDEYSLECDELQSGVCCWNGCSFTSLTLTSPEFISHVLFHPYHMFLKLVGRNVAKDRQLVECNMDSGLSNMLPSLEVQLQCCWNKGECGVVFDSVGEFYKHAHEHVTKDTRTCLWGGELIIISYYQNYYNYVCHKEILYYCMFTEC